MAAHLKWSGRGGLLSKTVAQVMVGLGLSFLIAPLFQAPAQERSSAAISPSHLTPMGFTLEKSTLDDVESKLGPAVPGACSKQADASKMICYIPAGAQRTKVIFESGPSGGWSVLDGFEVVSGEVNSTCTFKCKTTNALASNVQTDGGLRLGLTKSELLLLLGKPTKIYGSRYTFNWSSRRAMTKAEIGKSQRPTTEAYWTVDDTIEVTFRESRIVSFEIHHTVFD